MRRCPAYRLPPKHALAQLAATGCFNGVFYANAEDQLVTMLSLVNQVDDNSSWPSWPSTAVNAPS